MKCGLLVPDREGDGKEAKNNDQEIRTQDIKK
jgi:hypothetical protein